MLAGDTQENLMPPLPKCSRCGMCCIVAPCAFSEVDNNDVCIYLTVNEDDTTICNNKHANVAFVGSGCFLMKYSMKEVYNLHMEFYSVNERKQEIKAMGV